MQTATPPPAARIREIVFEGREKYGRSAMDRLEDAFLRALGMREKAVSSHPLQRPNLFVPSLSGKPWHEAAEFEGARILEENWEWIREEVFAARNKAFQRFDDGTPHSGDWNAMYIRYGAAPVEVNRHLIPRTTELVNALPRIGPMAMISALNPGAHIKPHCGIYNFRITGHLGLEIPEGCTFRVADETRGWSNGKMLVFDDSFEHEVWNRGSHTRYILLVDFWHPELTDAEVDTLNRIESMMASQRSRLDDGKYTEPIKWWE